MTSPAHDALIPTTCRLAASLGFDLVIPNPDPGRFGEHPDVFAVAEKTICQSGWRSGNGDELTIGAGNTAVFEVKRDPADFRADQGKPHRSRLPLFGMWFVYVCPPGVIKPEQLEGTPAGLYWLIGSTWKLKRDPLPRVIGHARSDEIKLLARIAADRSYAATHSLPDPVARRETGPAAGSPAHRAIQWLLDNPNGEPGKAIIRAIGFDGSEDKLARLLGRAGVVIRASGGIRYFYPPGAIVEDAA